MTSTVLNTKIGEIENKIPNASALVKKIDYNTTISNIEKKYFTTPDYNKFTSKILDVKIKEKGLDGKSNIYNLVKSFNLNTKVTTKAELKANQDKINKLETLDLSYFLCKIFFFGWWWFSKYVYLSTNV